jgi:cobalt-zinc-cadmium efflux system protein
MAADALVSVGVVVAGALTLAYAWTWVDPVTSLVIAAVIVVGTWGLFRQSLHLRFDGVPAHVDLDEAEHALAGRVRVCRPAGLTRRRVSAPDAAG